eukprot:m51a1_g12807 putative peptidylprolyl isomerase (143) ;mRNA; f:111-703
MSFARWALLAVVLCAAMVQAAPKKFEKLGVGVKFRPEKCDQKAEPGDKLKMHYTGTLASDGSKFDSSVDRDSPFEFTLGVGQVIKGWDNGIVGMCVGEKRKLKIPSDMGYGASGAGAKIPPNSDLIFEIELLGIERPGKAEL